jgi:hypothetical protein
MLLLVSAFISVCTKQFDDAFSITVVSWNIYTSCTVSLALLPKQLGVERLMTLYSLMVESQEL